MAGELNCNSCHIQYKTATVLSDPFLQATIETELDDWPTDAGHEYA